ncbi:MAG: DNA polymerase III subunit delta' [Lysobacteraceae bacterium]|nr:MAG: DNA polymerase III subunit delta' [Xanthomonadaceae bacterium]
MSGFAPWQQRVLDGALASLAEGRLGHALLFSGAAKMGKQEVAMRLSQRLLCPSPGADGLACGRCRACRLFAAGTHPDFKFTSYIPNDKGDKLRSELIVDQMRELGHWFSLTPQMGAAQVAMITPAHAMNINASNALLKTLEEPSRDRYLLLVTDRPGRLPATIRSRCQRLEFRPPGRAEAMGWLRAQGHGEATLAPALHAARGHPGLASDWLASGGLELRRQVLAELNALSQSRQSPIELAQQWLGDEHTALRLRFAAELALDAAAEQLGAGGATGLTVGADFQRLCAWFDGINRAREQLSVPALRHDLALAGLLLEWRSMSKATAIQGARR